MMSRGSNSPIRMGLRSLGLGVVVALAVSCARARVQNVQADVSPGLPPPGRVVVFDFEGEEIRVDPILPRRLAKCVDWRAGTVLPGRPSSWGRRSGVRGWRAPERLV